MEAFWVEPLQCVNSSGWAGAQPSGPLASHPAEALATQRTRPLDFRNLGSGSSTGLRWSQVT